MNTQALLLHTSPLFTPLAVPFCSSRKQFDILRPTSILNSSSTLQRIFIMATKSLLLSCLLVGLGIAQHPVSEATQAQDTPTLTSPAGFATSTDPPLPPELWECEILPEDLPKYNELASGVQEMFGFLPICLSPPTIPDIPECEALLEYVDFLRPKCSNLPVYDEIANTSGDVNTDSSGSWTSEPAGYAKPHNTNPPPIMWVVDKIRELGIPGGMQFHRSIQWCTFCPETTECQALSQQLQLDGLHFWDDNGVNNKSCTSSPPNEDETLLRQRDANAAGSRPAHGNSLEQQDADEPYRPALKSIYDDCDVLEDLEERTMCVLVELGRALCEREPWIRECWD